MITDCNTLQSSKNITLTIKRIRISDIKKNIKKLKISSDNESSVSSDNESSVSSDNESSVSSDNESSVSSDNESSVSSDNESSVSSDNESSVSSDNESSVSSDNESSVSSDNESSVSSDNESSISSDNESDSNKDSDFESDSDIKVELIKENTLDKETTICIKNEYLNINKNLKVVDKITTKYYAIIQYSFTGKPVYCKEWETHFDSDILNQMKGTNISSNKILPHWDLIPISFVFYNINKLPTVKLHIVNDIDFKKDIKIIINNDITFIFREINYDILKLKDHIKYNILKNLCFVTHVDSDRNIYKNKNMLDSDKAWALHLILNEKKIKGDKLIYLNYKSDNLSILSINDLYQCLYLHYSKFNI
jgi:hypothetical protein